MAVISCSKGAGRAEKAWHNTMHEEYMELERVCECAAQRLKTSSSLDARVQIRYVRLEDDANNGEHGIVTQQRACLDSVLDSCRRRSMAWPVSCRLTTFARHVHYETLLGCCLALGCSIRGGILRSYISVLKNVACGRSCAYASDDTQYVTTLCVISL